MCQTGPLHHGQYTRADYGFGAAVYGRQPLRALIHRDFKGCQSGGLNYQGFTQLGPGLHFSSKHNNHFPTQHSKKKPTGQSCLVRMVFTLLFLPAKLDQQPSSHPTIIKNLVLIALEKMNPEDLITKSLMNYYKLHTSPDIHNNQRGITFVLSG